MANKNIFDQTIVLDVETQKSLDSIDWDRSRLNELKTSVIGIYLYDQNKYLTLEEKEIQK
ncbi:hypothetical protein ISS85_02215 [Candidatus Microgenomates bacterium]|nr:hypothetical protein [Candidatus Microgenomates bacterium]